MTGWRWGRLLVLVALLWGGAALGQLPSLTGTEAPPPPTPETGLARSAPDLEAYGQIGAASTGAMIDTATRGVSVFQQRLARILRVLPDTPEIIRSTLAEASPDGRPNFFLGLALFVLVLLLIGRSGAMLFGPYVGRPIMMSLQKPHPVGMAEKLPVLAARVGLTAVGVLITLLIAVGVGISFFESNPAVLRTVAVMLTAYAGMIMIDTLWRMIISPYLSNYRLPRLTDVEAVMLYRWISPASAFAIVSIAAVVWLELVGVPPDVVAILRILVSLAIALLLTAAVVANRRAVTNAILSGIPRREAPWIGALASLVWAPLTVGYLVFAWVEESFRLVMGLDASIGLASAFVILLIGFLVYAVTVFIVERIFARARVVEAMNRAAEARRRMMEEERVTGARRVLMENYEGDSGDLDGDDDEEGSGSSPIIGPRTIPPRVGDPEPVEAAPVIPAPVELPGRRGMRTFEDLARRAASLFAMGVAAWVTLRLWIGEEIFVEGTFYDMLQDVIDTAFLGYILFHALRIWMDRRIEAEGVQPVSSTPGDEGEVMATSRIGTLLPLVRGFVLFTVAVSVALIIAFRLGVNVAPLFAGAGIVGLAIGFGAQTLVRDVLSGMFFLLDDAFRKGEYIDVGGVKGTVERISIRSFQLRHHLGPLNTVPFGEIKSLTNYSRDWVIMKLPLRLTYDTDVEHVRKVIKKLGQELMEHPVEGPKFVQPLKSQGVYMMEDSAMIIRVKFMTRPGDQWTTRKLVYQRIREIFAEEGIKFAHREVTVRIPGYSGAVELSSDQRHAVGAAVRTAVDDAEELVPGLASARIAEAR